MVDHPQRGLAATVSNAKAMPSVSEESGEMLKRPIRYQSSADIFLSLTIYPAPTLWTNVENPALQPKSYTAVCVLPI